MLSRDIWSCKPWASRVLWAAVASHALPLPWSRFAESGIRPPYSWTGAEAKAAKTHRGSSTGSY